MKSETSYDFTNDNWNYLSGSGQPMPRALHRNMKCLWAVLMCMHRSDKCELLVNNRLLQHNNAGEHLINGVQEIIQLFINRR